MLQEEMDYLQKLNTWRPIEKWKVPKHHLQRVPTEEKTLMRLLRFYLGWEKIISRFWCVWSFAFWISLKTADINFIFAGRRLCIWCVWHVSFLRAYFSLLARILLATRKPEFWLFEIPASQTPICKGLVACIQINQSEFYLPAVGYYGRRN